MTDASTPTPMVHGLGVLEDLEKLYFDVGLHQFTSCFILLLLMGFLVPRFIEKQLNLKIERNQDRTHVECQNMI